MLVIISFPFQFFAGCQGWRVFEDLEAIEQALELEAWKSRAWRLHKYLWYARDHGGDFMLCVLDASEFKWSYYIEIVFKTERESL
jgi:hypothetical protein